MKKRRLESEFPYHSISRVEDALVQLQEVIKPNETSTFLVLQAFMNTTERFENRSVLPRTTREVVQLSFVLYLLANIIDYVNETGFLPIFNN